MKVQSLALTPLALAVLIGAPAHAQQPASVPPPVIDVHMHAPGPAGMKEWEAARAELNVTKAVLIGTPLLWGDTRQDGSFLFSLTFPCEDGKLPNIGIPCFADGSTFPSIDMVRQLAKEGRIQALGELNIQYMGIAPDDPRLEPYYALAEELDLPIGLHLGIGPPGSAYQGPGFPPRKSPSYRGAAGDPHALEDVLVRHPKLRLYVAHAGWPMRDDMLYLLYMHPRLHVDVSVLQWAIPRPAYYSYLRDLVDAGFAKRIMFGSDGDVRRLRQGIEAIQTAEFLSEEQKRGILHDNAARFFKLAE